METYLLKMCCWLTRITGRLKTQEVNVLSAKGKKLDKKKLDHVMDTCKQEQNDPTLLAVDRSMSAPKKGPLGGAGLLDT